MSHDTLERLFAATGYFFSKLWCNYSAVLFIKYAFKSAFFAITQVISGTTNTNSLQAVDKRGSKAMQIIDCQFGTLIIPIIIKILAPTKEKACALHAKTVI